MHWRSWRTRNRSGYHLALQAQKKPHQGGATSRPRNVPRGVGKSFIAANFPREEPPPGEERPEDAKRKG